MSSTEIHDLEKLLADIKADLELDDLQSAVARIEALRPRDQATLFNELDPDEQDLLLPQMDPEDSADVLEELADEEAATVAGRLGVRNLANILDHMEPDEAADLLGDMPSDLSAEALHAMLKTEADEVRPLLIHADESAGGVMTAAEITLNAGMTVEQAIHHLRKLSPDSETIYYLFVVDNENHLAGVVSLRDLIVAPPDTRLSAIMSKDLISIHAGADQEEAARLMSRYDLLALPVVDAENHLLGVITYDDSFEVLEEEATEDIYRLGGVPEEQPINVGVGAAVRNRLPWLVLNLATALASAAVLTLFEDTLQQVVVLAAFFPIVTGVGGNAGTQTMTVIVRALALDQIDIKQALPILIRQLIIGLVNGSVLGVLVSLIALFWQRSPLLGLVVGVATLINQLTAVLAGVLVPFGFNLIKIDPALASPVLVSTVTDAFGYLFYLGLATLLITSLI
jgi:magnesium transporter